MNLRTKISALVLIVTVASVMVKDAHHFVAPFSHQQVAEASCHAHHGTPPISKNKLPAPASDQCCLVGHDTALVMGSDLPKSPTQQARMLRDSDVSSQWHSLFLLDVARTKVLSVDPRDLTSLRI